MYHQTMSKVPLISMDSNPNRIQFLDLWETSPLWIMTMLRTKTPYRTGPYNKYRKWAKAKIRHMQGHKQHFWECRASWKAKDQEWWRPTVRFLKSHRIRKYRKRESWSQNIVGSKILKIKTISLIIKSKIIKMIIIHLNYSQKGDLQCNYKEWVEIFQDN